MASAKINQLQLLQQNLQNVLGQKQQLESQLLELDSALTEVKTTEKAYRIIGKIMVASPTEKLSKELQEKREVIDIRLKNFARQEERLKAGLEGAQQEVLQELKQKKK